MWNPLAAAVRLVRREPSPRRRRFVLEDRSRDDYWERLAREFRNEARGPRSDESDLQRLIRTARPKKWYERF